MPDDHSNPFYPGAPTAPEPQASAELHWSAASTSGSKKPVNDDSWLVFSSNLTGATLLDADSHHSLSEHDLIFAVSDGMGGGNAGDVASSLLLEELSKVIPKTFKAAAQGFHPDYLELLDQTIRDIHHHLNEMASNNSELHGMGATLSLAWFTPENLYIAHVGDSRIYLHRADETQQLSEDHTYAWRKLNRGEINERQFRSHPRRSALFEVIGGGHRTIRPSVASIPYTAGDRFLLCSDGLIDGLWQKHIHAALARNVDSTKHTADALMSRALENAGVDDTTLILIEVR